MPVSISSPLCQASQSQIQIQQLKIKYDCVGKQTLAAKFQQSHDVTQKPSGYPSLLRCSRHSREGGKLSFQTSEQTIRCRYSDPHLMLSAPMHNRGGARNPLPLMKFLLLRLHTLSKFIFRFHLKITVCIFEQIKAYLI